MVCACSGHYRDGNLYGCRVYAVEALVRYDGTLWRSNNGVYVATTHGRFFRVSLEVGRTAAVDVTNLRSAGSTWLPRRPVVSMRHIPKKPPHRRLPICHGLQWLLLMSTWTRLAPHPSFNFFALDSSQQKYIGCNMITYWMPASTLARILSCYYYRPSSPILRQIFTRTHISNWN